MTSIAGGIAAFIVGSGLAGATLFGLVTSQTAAPDTSPVTIGNGENIGDVIQYGSN